MTTKSKHIGEEELAASSRELTDFDALPFSRREAAAVKECLRRLASSVPRNDESIVDKSWREVHLAAVRAVAELNLESEEYERSRVGQKMRRLIKAASPILTDDFESLISLAFGAWHLGLIRHIPSDHDRVKYRKVLSRLNSEQIRASAGRALTQPLDSEGQDKTPLLLSDEGGRPASGALDDYVATLRKIYEGASNQPLVVKSRIEGQYTKRKPVVIFVKLCLAPQEFGIQDLKHPARWIRDAILRSHPNK